MKPIFLLFLLIGFLDLVGLGLIGQFVALAFGSANAPSLEQMGLSRLNIEIVGSFLLLVFALKTGVGVWANKKIFEMAAMVEAELRVALLRRYQGLPYQVWLVKNSSEYINSINVWVPQYARLVLMSLLRLMAEALVACLILGFLFLINPWGFIILLAIIASVAILYEFLLRRKNKSYAKEFKNISAQVITDVRQAMDGIKEIRVLGVESYFSDRIAKSSKALCIAQASSNTISNSARYFLEFAVVGFAVLIPFMAPEDGRTVDMVPIVAIFGAGAMRLVTLFNLLTVTSTQLGFYRQVVRSLYDDLKLDEVQSRLPEDAKPDYFFNKLVVKNLSFSYSNESVPVLVNVNLEIKSGDKLLLLGSSGSGKSTLVDILLGILPPTGGAIDVTDVTGQAIDGSVAKYASYLPQATFLIDDSIRRNVALGVADHLINELKVRDALSRARILGLIEGLPEGLDTQVGDRGLRLSGGQRQRIAIARAIYLGRTILFLDEATNAIDIKTEEEILNDLLIDNDDLTVVCISHRDELSVRFDRVCCVKDGLIIEFK
ncbi:ABC transporter ATP-binding protein [Polynucleobacter paneuropaeus]|nr:ABC transporter ATP-binding protein [Polynucleobacter paneuropaeus]